MVVLAIISVSTFIASVNADTVVKIGDINNNGEIDSNDYMLLKRAYFGTFKLNDVQEICGDCNQNGSIDSNDYVLAKRVYFGTFGFQNPDIIIPDSNTSESEDSKYEDDGFYTEVVKP